MSGPGCYTLDLYCDQKPCKHPDAYWGGGFPYQYTGHTEGDCKRDARHDGWKLSRDRKHDACPHCTK